MEGERVRGSKGKKGQGEAIPWENSFRGVKGKKSKFLDFEKKVGVCEGECKKAE